MNHPSYVCMYAPVFLCAHSQQEQLQGFQQAPPLHLFQTSLILWENPEEFTTFLSFTGQKYSQCIQFHLRKMAALEYILFVMCPYILYRKTKEGVQAQFNISSKMNLTYKHSPQFYSEMSLTCSMRLTPRGVGRGLQSKYMKSVVSINLF